MNKYLKKKKKSSALWSCL